MQEAISRRHLFTRKFRPLRAAVAAAIAQADPIRLLELGAPGDEYDAEVTAIMPLLISARSREEVRALVRDEFVRRFGDETAGPPERYDEAATAIWRALSAASTRLDSRRGPS